jgi:hypothetical protein
MDPSGAEVLGALRVLTRRIGLELIVPQYPALARVPAPSEQGTMQDEKGAGPFSTGWEHPVESDPPSQEQGPCPARRTGSCHSSGRFPAWKAPWALPIAFPIAGEGEKRSFKPNGRRKRAGRPRWARKRRASARRRWTLQPAHPRARDRRCLSDADWGISQSSTRPSQVDVIAGCPCGESRSGPDP